MCDLLAVQTPSIIVKDNQCFCDYTHHKQIISQQASGKYALNSEFTKYTIKTDLSVPKGRYYSDKLSFTSYKNIYII